MICSRCGYNNRDESQFCVKCGQRIKYAVQKGENTGGVLSAGMILQERYRVIKQLGRGGMGVVYLANDSRFLNRVCVVKEMMEFLLDESERQRAVVRFNQEADLLASINHPNVPQVYDRFSENNKHYLVMEFVEGIDLKDVLHEYMNKHASPIPEDDGAVFLMQLCITLRYIHNHKPSILHRDIKPSNILIAKNGMVKLVDFGIAKAIQTNTQGTSIGTQGYAAPEQYKGLADIRTDLYSLGATMHHILTGRDPQKEAPFDYPPLCQINNNISKDLSDLIEWMLSMDINSRPPNSDTVIDRLKLIYPGIELRVLNNQIDSKIVNIVLQRIEVNNNAEPGNLCPECCHENKNTSRFCIKCGHTLGSSDKHSFTGLSNEPSQCNMFVPPTSKFATLYPGGFNECIRVPAGDGTNRLNVILERYYIDGLEFIYMTERLPSIIGQAVYPYNVVRSNQGNMQYIKPVSDRTLKEKLYSHWREIVK